MRSAPTTRSRRSSIAHRLTVARQFRCSKRGRSCSISRRSRASSFLSVRAAARQRANGCSGGAVGWGRRWGSMGISSSMPPSGSHTHRSLWTRDAETVRCPQPAAVGGEISRRGRIQHSRYGGVPVGADIQGALDQSQVVSARKVVVRTAQGAAGSAPRDGGGREFINRRPQDDAEARKTLFGVREGR